MLTLGVPTELGGMGAVDPRDRRSSTASSPSTAARPPWPCRCTTTSPRSRRGGGAAACRAPRPRCARRRRRDRARVDRRRRLHEPAGHGRQGRRWLPGQRPQAVRQPVARRLGDVDDVHATTTPSAGRRVLNTGRAVRRRASPSTTRGTRWACVARRATTSRSTTCSSPDERDPRRPPARRRRPAAAGDLQHRVPDRLGRLPRRRRVGGRRRRSRPCATVPTRPTTQRQVGPDAATACGSPAGRSRAPSPPSATTRRRRWRPSPR